MNKDPDSVWRKATPFFPKFVAGRFRRKGLERRSFLVGGLDFQQVQVVWRLAHDPSRQTTVP